jgi:Nucleotidyl transferase AbiEii toxin, Type IV TA system
MEPLFTEWSEFLQSLTRHRVRFVLVGGHAVAVHARPRHTEDLDVFVDPTPANASRLRAALVDFGFGSVAPTVEVLATPGKVFMLGRKPYRIDVLTAIDGVTFPVAWKARVRVPLAQGSVFVIGRRELVANKKAAGRPKDLADLVMLAEEEPRRPSAKRAPAAKRKREQ